MSLSPSAPEGLDIRSVRRAHTMLRDVRSILAQAGATTAAARVTGAMKITRDTIRSGVRRAEFR